LNVSLENNDQSNPLTCENEEDDDEEPEAQNQITKYFPGGTVKKIQSLKPKKRHPKSLLKDDSIPMRYVEGSQNIFEIIMPWKAETEEEKKLKQVKGGKKKQDGKKQQKLDLFYSKPGAKKVDSQQINTSSANQHSDSEEENPESIKRLAQVKKVKEVQSLKFERYAQQVQAILINPRWQPTEHIIPNAPEEFREY
jgi:hypothetical protein